MKRIVSLWLPSFATDRRRWRPHPSAVSSTTPAAPGDDGSAASPTAVVAAGRGGHRLAAVNAAARSAGLRPGLSLADARAVRPDLVVHAADAAADVSALERLADRCEVYTPWTAVDRQEDGGHGGPLGGGAGLWLDVGGSAHLFGGEAALLERLCRRMNALGLAADAAVADTAGAAWAVARFGAGGRTIVATGETSAALAPLPLAALRLSDATVDDLHRVGLRRIGDLLPLPRAPLAARFGDRLLERLDQALGRCDEPLSPRRPPPALAARLILAELVGRREDIAALLRHLLSELEPRLAALDRGARRLELALHRVDGGIVRRAVGTSRPSRDPAHLARLFDKTLENGIDIGFGVEAAVLSAVVVEPLAPRQPSLGAGSETRDAGAEDSVARLIDRLSTWLGPDGVVRFTARASHLPERACREVPALAGDPPPPPEPPENGHRSRRPRPLKLFPSPELIEVIAPVPDGPPVLFRWRRMQHQVTAAEGPERIGPEWWRLDGGLTPDQLDRVRDYYRLEDTDGQRFWVYRDGLYRADRPPRWFLHGLFA